VRLKFLLRPGWIGTILLIVVFSVLCFTVLAPWQFGRNKETETQNAAIQASYTEAPKPLSQVLPHGRAPDSTTEWTKVTFHGTYLPAGETIAWLRTVQGEPAMEVLTPFRVDDGSVLLVDRGYVRPVNPTQAPPYAAPPAGPQTLVARVRPDETDSKHRPAFSRDGHHWTYSVDSGVVASATDLPIQPGYFALTEGQPGVLTALPLPQLDSGPFFSYALQWITFGIMAPLGIGYLIYNELRPSDAFTPPESGEDGSGDEPKRPRTGRRRRMSVAQVIAEEERQEREEAARRS
jgi:cytochrome oxidase assembly protein ShyY1